eukprot:SAG31_NODE_7216_length_1752_cov_123.586812_2_plen_162_part_00
MPESELEASVEPQQTEPEASAQPQSEREASAEPHSEPEVSAEPESDLEASAEPQISEPEVSAEEPESEPNKASAESSWSIVLAEWLAIMIIITAIVYGMWLLLGPVTVFTAWSRGFTDTTTLFGDTRHHLRSLCACTSEYAFPSCRFDFEATVAVPGWQSM